jgi:hypothetical protein
MLLRECHRPFVLPRPTTAPTATPKRELSLTNAMGQRDACDRDGAFADDLNPAIDAQRRLIARWSCSMRLLRSCSSGRSRSASTDARAAAATAHGGSGRIGRASPCAAHAGASTREPSKECLRSGDPPVASEQEIDGLAILVDSTMEIVPLGLDRDVRLVHPPRRANRLGKTVPPLLKLRHVPGHPAKDRRVGDLDAALRHHLDQVPIRQPIGDIPPHAELNNVRVKGSLAVNRVAGGGDDVVKWSLESRRS